MALAIIGGMPETPVLFWFRHDLRLSDNPALTAAAAAGPVVAAYILDNTGAWPMGGASLWWLHHSLESLQKDLAAKNVSLVLRKGDAAHIIPKLLKETGAQKIFWNRVYEPDAQKRDHALQAELEKKKIEVKTFNASLLYEPHEIKNGSGNPFRVFTPFSKACLKEKIAAPVAAPRQLEGAKATIESDALKDWQLLPTKPDWAKGFKHWKPGEKHARDRLYAFLDGALADYPVMRDRPDRDGTSRLSPHLHFGEISPRQIYHAAMHVREREAGKEPQIHKFILEVLWREFSYHLLDSFPKLPSQPLAPSFKDFPWEPNQKYFKAWTKGQTGVPIVDAGMRELWQTGFMHNRVRMITASYLIKNLMQPWQKGEAWFWDCLVDADLANNSASWQWVAGCGADASPYYRIFNPVLQGEKFDPNGAYVRRFVPELAELPDKLLHAPWEADPVTLASHGVVLGKTYPQPLVDLKKSREAALDAFKRIKRA
jgi:deoxyribodipyrimidine photo-lyase